MDEADLLLHAESFTFDVPASLFQIVVARCNSWDEVQRASGMWAVASTTDLRHAHFFLKDQDQWRDGFYTPNWQCYPYTRDQAVQIAVRLAAARCHPMIRPV